MSAEGINLYPTDQGQQTQLDFIRRYIEENGVRSRTAILTSAAASTPVVLVPEGEVPAGKTPLIVGFIAKVNGGTLWGTTANVKIQTADASPIDYVTALVAALTANAVVQPETANVTIEDAYSLATGGEAGKGLQVVGDADGTGSDLHVTVFYKFINATAS